MTTYNHERFVAQAIDGALMQQTTFPFEIVIGEDYSTDRTREIVLDYGRRYPEQIQMVLPEQNLGANAMYLEVLKAARGEYFAMLDGDDYWSSPNKLQVQAEFLDSRQECSLCFHDIAPLVEGRDRGLSAVFPGLSSDTHSLSDLLIWNFLPYVSVMTRRFRVDELQDWFSDFVPMDWLSWIVVARKGLLGYIKDVMGVYRIHEGGLWWGGIWEDLLLGDLAVYEKLGQMLGPEYGEALRLGALTRRVALAVETCGIPYDRPVLILSAVSPRYWYLNGRLVYTAADTAANCLEAVERLSRTGSERRPQQPEVAFRATTRFSEAPHLITTTHSAGEIDTWEAVEAALLQYEVVWRDQHCIIYQLPVRAPAPEWEVVSVRQVRPLSNALMGGHIDSPSQGDHSGDGGVEILGWALGRSRVAAVQFWMESRLLVTTPLNAVRVDVGEAFSDISEASQSGFRAWVDLIDLPKEAHIKVVVSLENGQTHPLGEVHLRARNLSKKGLRKFAPWLGSETRPA